MSTVACLTAPVLICISVLGGMEPIPATIWPEEHPGQAANLMQGNTELNVQQ